jgi:hypothetical protein
MRVDPIPGVAVMVAVNTAVGTAVTVEVLVGDGFNVGVCVGKAIALDEGVAVRLGLSAAGAGVRLAAADGVASLTGTLPGCGRLQLRVINIIPIKQTAFVFIFFLSKTLWKNEII